MKWEHIFIIKQTQQYLSNLELIEISSSNKYLREKFKLKVLKNIKLDYKNISQISNLFDYSGDLITDESEIDYEVTRLKSSKAGYYVREIAKEIDSISLYYNSFEFFDLLEVGYFIIPSVCNFNQLTKLILYGCTMGLKDFVQLLKKLEKLECLVLSRLSFLALGYEGSIEDDFLLPVTLKELTLSHMKSYTANFITDSDVILYNSDYNTRETVYLPAQHLPNLRKFELFAAELFAAIEDSNFIPNFLSLNPQLIDIKLPIKNLDFKAIKSLSNNGNIKHLTLDLLKPSESFSKKVKLPELHSLSSFTTSKVTKKRYSLILKLLETCPNLTKLDVTLNDYDLKFIGDILENLKHLKSIKLGIQHYSTGEFNLSIFSNIEVLKIDIWEDTEIYYKLPTQPFKLKMIIIAPNNKFKGNFEFLKEEHVKGSNWKIKLIGKAINCRAVKN